MVSPEPTAAPPRTRVLVADDKENFLALFRRMAPEGMDLVCVSDGAAAIALLEAQDFDVVVSDIRMPGADGHAVLRRTRELSKDVEVVLMTAFGTIPDAVAAMKEGAFDYLTKPFDPYDALAVIERAAQRRRLRRAAREAGSLVESDEAQDVGSATAEELSSLSYREALNLSREKATREYLVTVLQAARGNVTLASERAGIERESFHRLLKRHGIRPGDYRGR